MRWNLSTSDSKRAKLDIAKQLAKDIGMNDEVVKLITMPSPEKKAKAVEVDEEAEEGDKDEEETAEKVEIAEGLYLVASPNPIRALCMCFALDIRAKTHFCYILGEETTEEPKTTAKTPTSSAKKRAIRKRKPSSPPTASTTTTKRQKKVVPKAAKEKVTKAINFDDLPAEEDSPLEKKKKGSTSKPAATKTPQLSLSDSTEMFILTEENKRLKKELDECKAKLEEMRKLHLDAVTEGAGFKAKLQAFKDGLAWHKGGSAPDL